MSTTQKEPIPQETPAAQSEAQSTPQSATDASTTTPTLIDTVTAKLQPEAWHKQAAKLAVLIAMLILVLFMLGIYAYGSWSIFWRVIATDDVVTLYMQTTFEHFAVLVALPFAALGSLCLVLLLRYAAGPIEFEGLGFKFRGASGPIVMWALCYLVIAVSIKLLW
jgi:hypothetical protein